MKEKHYFVKSWAELKKLVNNLNHHKETLILCGFVNKLVQKNDIVTFKTEKIVFKKVNVKILRKC